jgi:hypothetical protein
LAPPLFHELAHYKVKAVSLGTHMSGAPGIHDRDLRIADERDVSKRRNTMSKEEKVKQIEQEEKASELSDQDLENAAGGTIRIPDPFKTSGDDPHCGTTITPAL